MHDDADLIDARWLFRSAVAVFGIGVSKLSYLWSVYFSQMLLKESVALLQEIIALLKSEII